MKERVAVRSETKYVVFIVVVYLDAHRSSCIS